MRGVLQLLSPHPNPSEGGFIHQGEGEGHVQRLPAGSVNKELLEAPNCYTEIA